MQRSKDITFIGFAIKSRGIVLGVNSIKHERKYKHLIILCGAAANNTFKEMTSYAGRYKIPLIKTCGVLLEEIVNKSNCKAAAITDKNLADAILTNLSDKFQIISGGIFNE